MLYCIVCFYDKEMMGKFTIDYVFRNSKLAFETLKEYNRLIELDEDNRSSWPQLYITTEEFPQYEEDSFITLDQHTKKLFMGKKSGSGIVSCKVPIPPISTEVPDEFIV